MKNHARMLIPALALLASTAFAAAPEPCCSVTALDVKTGVVTAKVEATGGKFQFKVTDARLLRSIEIGQGVFANFKSREVSLDGNSACCSVVGALPAAPGTRPAAPPPPTAPSAAPEPERESSGPSSAAIRVAERPRMSRLAAGQRWKLVGLAGRAGSRSLDGEAVYQIEGREGILEAPIPETVRQKLLADPERPGPEDLYIVHKSTAERVRVDASGALTLTPLGGAATGPSGEVTEGGSSGLDCDDPFGWGNEISQHAEIGFQLGSTPISWTLEDQAVASKSSPGLHVSGKLRVKFPLRARLAGGIKVRVLEVACVPVAVKLKHIRVHGTFDVESQIALEASLGLTQEMRTQLVREPLGGFVFFVGPIPVYLGCEAYLDATMRWTAPNLVQVSYAATGRGSGEIDLKCTTGTCSGTRTFEHEWRDDGDVTLLAQGVRALVRPGLEAGLRAYINDPDFIQAYFAVRPYLQADLWAATPGQCDDTPGIPDAEPAAALTADLDAGLDVVAGVDTFLPAVAKEFDLYTWQKHLKFRDLVGSTALGPVVRVDPPASAGAPETFTVRMRSCYPYEDDVRYELRFGDGSKASSGWGPPDGLKATHTYAAEGSYRLDALAVEDRHGRSFSASATAVPVDVAAARPTGTRTDATPAAVPASTAVGSAAQSGSGRKSTSSGGGGLSSLDPKSVPVTASETATTTLAIRGMTAPEEARVTAIDAATRIVTATTPSRPEVRFGLRAQDALPSVGQKIWLDSATGTVSVDGTSACCSIVAPAAAPQPARPSSRSGRMR